MEENIQITDQPRSLTIEWVFDAPRGRVFGTWIDPKQVARWWGPKGFTNPVTELDPRVGGLIRIDMRWPNGDISPMTGEFCDIEASEKLVFTTDAVFNKDGQPLLENLNTVMFQDFDGKTIVTLRVVVKKAAPEAASALAGMEQGWNESFDKLAEILK